MYKRASVASFIVLTLFALSGFSQVEWGRYAWGTPNREGFSVLLPVIPTQISQSNGEQGIEGERSRGSNFVPLENPISFNATFQDGVSKEAYDKQIEAWMNFVGAPGDGGGGVGSGGMSQSEKAEREREKNLNRNTRAVSVCGFSGIEFGNSNSVQQFFLIDARLYHLWVTGANRSNAEAARFLKSFALVSPWERWVGMRVNENFEDLIISARSQPAFESSVCKNVGVAGAKKIADNRARNSPLRLISRPPAIYPEAEKKNLVNGTVSLRITFLQDGSIGEITVLKGLSKAFNESAVNAAKLIKFEPQRTGGKFVTITKTVEYGFAIY